MSQPHTGICFEKLGTCGADTSVSHGQKHQGHGQRWAAHANVTVRDFQSERFLTKDEGAGKLMMENLSFSSPQTNSRTGPAPASGRLDDPMIPEEDEKEAQA